MEAAENETTPGCTKERYVSFSNEGKTELSKEDSALNVASIETVVMVTEPDLILNNNETAQNSCSNKRKKDCSETPNKSSNTYNEDDNDEVQVLLDTEIVSCVSEIRNRNSFIRDNSSDDETDIAYESDGGCNFISEIMADDEPKLRERCMEQIHKDLEDKTKRLHNNILVDLIEAQRLVLERDSLFTKLIKKLQEEIHECEEKQKQIRKKIMDFSKSTTAVREPSYTRSFFKKFGMPYFEDSGCFTAPPNKDHKKKIENGQLVAVTMPKVKYWSKRHKDKLQEAIKTTIKNEHSEKLMKTINKLKRDFENTTDLAETVKVEEKLVASQNELKSLKTIPYSKLLENENPLREYDWMKYSASVFNGAHSAEECRRFWHVYLKPSINKSGWDYQEDLKLVEIAEQMHFQDWETIAKVLGTNRTAYQCFVHYQTRMNNQGNFFAGKWTKEEDDKLLAVINASKIGQFIPWTKVASHFSHRTHNQIYARFVKSLDPKLVKGRFTKDEDLLIVSGVEVFGATYKEIASLMSNRSSIQVRERYERYLIPKTNKTGSWSLEEDEQLLSLSKELGYKDFAAIAEQMKTRSRTQVRQRFNFIQKMLKSNPGWTPHQVKRKKKGNSTTNAFTQKLVERVKRNVETVEEIFKLTKIESDTFRIEKMKELRDKMLMKKYDLRRKKGVFSDCCLENYLLIGYFKPFNHKSTVKVSRAANGKDFNAYLNEILLLAKYFGHELKLPKFEDEIIENPKLSFQLKLVLRDNLNNITSTPSRNTNVEFDFKVPLNSENRVDYETPLNDDTFFMTEWWHNPPINVKNLNFSEFFKRTVFDYSYGMHKDIWESKEKRSQISNVTIEQVDIESSPNFHQSLFIAPNQLTLLGYKSLIMTRARLRRLSNKSTKHRNQNDGKNIPIKDNCDLKISLIKKFQETLLSLFTWPKMLSLTNIASTPILPANTSTSSSQISTLNHRNIVSLINNSDFGVDEELQKTFLPPKNKKQENKIIKQAVLKQNLKRKRKITDFKKGISFKRKMNIEHLMDNVKEKSEPEHNLTKVRTYGNKYKGMTRNNGLNNTGATNKVNEICVSLCSRTEKYLEKSTEQQSTSTKSHLSCRENKTKSNPNPSNKENYVLD